MQHIDSESVAQKSNCAFEVVKIWDVMYTLLCLHLRLLMYLYNLYFLLIVLIVATNTVLITLL